MANLVRVFEVYLYVGFTPNAKKCYDMIKYLKDKEIPYTLLNYSDQFEHHKINIDALSTWYFGPDSVKNQFKDFPIVVWKEGFDDFSSYIQYCDDVKLLPETALVKNKDLIK